MENMFDAFNRLPYWDGASMFINASETCATRKLLQCRDFGTYQNDITRKFQQGELPDLPLDHFKERKKAFQVVQDWITTHEQDPADEWIPILYNFEAAKNSAKRNQDWGHVVFVSCTLSRFLLIMCFGPDQDGHGKNAHEQYSSLTKYHADHLFSLAKYVYNGRPEPDWVRATYTTFSSSIDPRFLSSIDPALPSDTHPPIHHVTAQTFVPSLTESELERIDSTMMQSRSWKVPPRERHDAVVARHPRPKPIHSTWLCGKTADACGNCGKVATTKMPQCGECKIVRYCDRECQRAHWKTHKKYCRKAGVQTA